MLSREVKIRLTKIREKIAIMSQYNFQIGERTKPMELEAKIYIEDNGLEHPYVGNRFHKLHLP